MEGPVFAVGVENPRKKGGNPIRTGTKEKSGERGHFVEEKFNQLLPL